MKNILRISALLLLAASLQGQVIRTVGIAYTAGAPAFTPSASGSFIAYDTTGREFYEFFGGVWSKAGQNIDQIAGAVPPAYTPTKMDARFAINASGQLYWWNGSAWVQVGGLSEPVASLSFSNNNNAVATGRLQYSDDVGDFVFGGIGGTQLEVTQKHVYYIRNAEATTLAAGEVVYAFGTLGASGRITVKRYIANGTIPSKYVIGIVAAPIAAGADGYAVDFGKIRGLNTDAFLDGDVLYASATVAGQLTKTAPVAPNFRLPIAFVVHKSATVGVLAVRINGGYALEDLHNVAATAPTNGQVLTYNTSTSTWGPATPADGSATNELQTLSHASDATSHTVTLSDGGGSLKLIEGHHTLLTTANTSEVTIGTAQDTLCMIIACSDETTNLTTGTKVTFRAPFRMNIVSVRANVNTAPTGANIIVDINEGGTTIMSTNKIVIETNETTSLDATTQPGVTDADIAADAECTIDIDQIGSAAAGKGLKVHIYYTKKY